MKKLLYLLITTLMLAMLVGCSGKEEESDSDEIDEKADTKGVYETLMGEWYCREHLLEDENEDTGYLKLDVRKSNEFSIYDCAAGNPGISGKMKVVDDNTLKLECKGADFDPPPSWEKMSKKQTIKFELEEDNNVLYLIYEDDNTKGTLVFDRIVEAP